MKKEKVIEKLDKHCSEKLYVRLTRKKGSFEGISTGFILDKSPDFILLQETDEFRGLGYQVIPIQTIKHVRYNKNDKTIHRILKEEGLISEIKAKYKVDLTDWNSIVKDIKATAMEHVFAKEIESLDDASKETVEKMMAYFEKKYMSVPMKMAKEILLKK